MENKEKEIKFLVPLFIATNTSDDKLAKLSGLTIEEVKQCLTDKEGILDVFNENTIKEVFKEGIKGFYPANGEELYKEIQIRRNTVKKEEKTIKEDNFVLLDINKLSDEQNNAFLMLGHMILTFRTKLSTVSELTGIDENTLFTKLKSNFSYIIEPLKYLNNYEMYDQNKAKEEMLNFYYRFVEVNNKLKKINDLNREDLKKLSDEKRNLFRLIDDSSTKRILNRESGDRLSDEDILIILKYQLKYSLTHRQIANFFNIDSSTYLNRLHLFLVNNSELKERYDELAYYNDKKYYWDRNRK